MCMSVMKGDFCSMKISKSMILVCAAVLCAVSCSEKSSGTDSSETTVQPTTTQAVSYDPSMVGPAQGKTPASLPAEAENVVRNFTESSATGDVDTMIKCMFPDEMLDAIEKFGVKQQFAVAISSSAGGKLSSFSTENCYKLGGEAIRISKNYYDSFAENLQIKSASYSVTDGYCLDITVDAEVNGEKSTFTDPVSVIMIEGSGWKVIPASEESILDMERQEEQTEPVSQE